MDAYGDELAGSIDAWGEEQLAASPEWASEHYVSILRRCRDATACGTPAG